MDTTETKINEEKLGKVYFTLSNIENKTHTLINILQIKSNLTCKNVRCEL